MKTFFRKAAVMASALLIAVLSFQQANAATVSKTAHASIVWNSDAAWNPLSSSKNLLSGVNIPSWMFPAWNAVVKDLYEAWMDDSGNVILAFVEYVGDFAQDNSFGIKVRRFDKRLDRIPFGNGSQEISVSSFSYPWNGSPTDFPTARVSIRVDPSWSFFLAWQAYETTQYATKVQAFAADGSTSGILASVNGSLTGMEFAQMDLWSVLVGTYSTADGKARVMEAFPSGPNAWISKTMVVQDGSTEKQRQYHCYEVSWDFCSQLIGMNNYVVPFVNGNSQTAASSVRAPIPTMNNSPNPLWLKSSFLEKTRRFQYVRSANCQVVHGHWSGIVKYQELSETVGTYCPSGAGAPEIPPNLVPQEWGGMLTSLKVWGFPTSQQTLYYHSGFDERFRTVPVKALATSGNSPRWNKFVANRKGVVVWY